eukprot:gnl/MRDRNA2_/MRDRNA2_29886_c0_seq2.p1 gnl/MRDRNA2_/MRDRNA2_29886_c0~~gnl/MRDRNA2_/MRDRNA2_29886_c0_seq2.p1  ORF type:complete len:129 (+),score=20.83 gnl/MRDRNA2_/MRDRNA2_29886_c0_seq2:88-474(+)
MDQFTKGGWKTGLFEVSAEPGGMNAFLMSWCCGCFNVAEIHAHMGAKLCGLSKQLACVASWCGVAPYFIFIYGQEIAKKKGFEEPAHCGILKLWCCGACYLAQEYRECAADGMAVKPPADIIKGISQK